MKAVRLNQWGQSLQHEDIPQPAPASDEVLIRVHAASINPVDSAVMAGYLQSMLTVPLTLGTDFAGDVVTVGTDVRHVKPGDAVYGMIPLSGGTFAEYVVAKAHQVAAKPRSLDYIQAAAVPLTALAAWQALAESAQLQRGERVMIHGAAGGVGSFAVQLAKDRGAYVIGTDIPEKASFLKELGADQIINVQGQRFEDVVQNVDVVLQLASGDPPERFYDVLKSGGRFVTTVGQPSEEEAERRGIRAYSVFVQPTIDNLTKIAELIDAGRLKVFVNRTFPIDDVQAAFEFKPKDGIPGKIVLTVN